MANRKKWITRKIWREREDEEEEEEEGGGGGGGGQEGGTKFTLKSHNLKIESSN